MEALLYDSIGKDYHQVAYQITKCSLMCNRICLNMDSSQYRCIPVFLDGSGIFGDENSRRKSGLPDHLIYLLLIFFLVVLKDIVNETPADSDLDFAVGIEITAATILERPGIFANVRQSMRRRCHVFIIANGRNF
ncbi:hypothetical protein AVEN_195777-1 [Araneus ventricosus]|uniref:Uncharacterized protein n=1 Tax=Araneus ventricosus TaxID=182803 RepID=A0A4Y2S312_ARAVE|nr:hypothetical protein AVEN_148978-1 [Araneus ventricosus]GBN82320.1 hypothetical protein AVEN_195777-1 [Araneus ventricosus]